MKMKCLRDCIVILILSRIYTFTLRREHATCIRKGNDLRKYTKIEMSVKQDEFSPHLLNIYTAR